MRHELSAKTMETFLIGTGSEILRAVTVDVSFMWDVTPYNPVKVQRCFGGT
jgi:hypothetical protein